MPSFQLPGRSNGRRSSSPVRSLNDRPGALGALSRYVEKSYAADYCCLILIVIGWSLIQVFSTPMYRMFRLDDPAIQYPYATNQRISTWMSTIYAGFIPMIIILLWCAIIRPERHFSHVSVLGFLICVWLTSFVTDLLKNAIGRPRPDLISRCAPSLGTPQHTPVTWEVCTVESAHKLQEGWRSFPSGHSSFAWSGFGFLAMFFAGQTHALRPRSSISSILFSASPLVGAIVIACSRHADYRHDIYDITSGSLLGFGLAYLTYRRYFPGLRAPQCDVPYEKETPESGFRRVAEDDEEAAIADERTGATRSHDGSAADSPAFPLIPRAS